MGFVQFDIYQFTPIPANTTGTHPAFADQDALNRWLLANFSIGTPVVPILIFTPVAANYAQNILLPGTVPAGDGYSSFALLTWSTDANSVTVDYQITNQYNDSIGLGVFINGTFLQYLSGAAGHHSTSVDLSSVGGAKKLVLSTSSQLRGGSSGNRDGATIMQVTFPTGSTNALQAPTANTKRVVYFSDSIGVGYGTSAPPSTGVVPQLRTHLGAGWDVISYGWSGNQYTGNFSSPAQVGAAAQLIVNELTGATQKVLMLAVATNDWWIAGVSAATTAGYAKALADKVKALDSSIRIIIAGPLNRYDLAVGTTNTAGSTIQDYSNAFVGLKNYGYETINEFALLTSNYLVDGVHPTDAGALIKAVKEGDVILSQSATSYTGVTVGETIQDNSTDANKIVFVGPWQNYVGSASVVSGGTSKFLDTAASGYVEIYFNTRYLDLIMPCDSGQAANRPNNAVLSLDGSPVAGFTQRVTNSNPNDTSPYAYYTTPDMGAGEHILRLTFSPNGNGAPLFDAAYAHN